jgi:hypothetical protein
LEPSFVEPTAGFSDGSQDGSTLRLQAGARFGTAFNANGISFEPTPAVLAYSNVIADGTAVATVPVPAGVTPTDQGLLPGEVDPELNIDFNNGYSAYVRGSVRFGSELVGGFAKGGAAQAVLSRSRRAGRESPEQRGGRAGPPRQAIRRLRRR